MIYFDSDISKSTNTVVYFDWKTVIYIYVCGKCRTQFRLQFILQPVFFYIYYHHFKFKRKCFHIISVLLTVYFKVKENRGRRDRDHMVVGFTTTCAISVYHH